MAQPARRRIAPSSAAPGAPRLLATALASALTLVLGSCGGPGGGSPAGSSTAKAPRATISGAGSTFAAPVYEQWGSEIRGLTLNYQAVGSGAGVTALAERTVDFGGSDPPLTGAELRAVAANGSPAVEIPMFLGAITVSYNLPGIKSGLRLSAHALADIYRGTVKRWDAHEIAALNPGLSLPSTPITVVHRSDSSGTTAGFTGFLAATDPEWAHAIGAGKDVQWPTGIGAKGNAGVAGAIEQTPGGVGYLEQAYALKHDFTYASIENRSGRFVAPTLASTTAAASGVKVPPSLGFAITSPAGPDSYPITSQTFLVVNRDLCKAGLPGGARAARGVGTLLQYGLGRGQAILALGDYARLPAPILERASAAVRGLECNGAPLVATRASTPAPAR